MFVREAVYDVSIVRDGWDIFVTVLTALAFPLAAFSFWFTARERKKSLRRITEERSRRFDLQALSRILAVTETEAPRTRSAESAVSAQIMSLSPETRALLPHTKQFFSSDALDRDELIGEIQSRLAKHPQFSNATAMWDWLYDEKHDERGNFAGWIRVSDHITYEIVNAISARATEPLR